MTFVYRAYSWVPNKQGGGGGGGEGGVVGTLGKMK